MINSEYQACPILTIEEEKSEINQSLYCNIISITLIRSILSSVQIKDNKSVTRQWKNKETQKKQANLVFLLLIVYCDVFKFGVFTSDCLL